MSQDSKNENKTCTPESETAEAVRDEAVENAQAEANAEAEQTAQDAEAEKASGKKDPKDAKIEELQDRLRRQMAEFDNFRKRTEKEKSAMYEVGARDIIEKILPVLDNFERGLAAVPEDEKGSSFAEGIEKIYKQFVKTLEDAGVEAIEAKGQQFDPNLHNAVMHVEDESAEENTVVEVFQAGFRLGEKVIRFAMVKVAN